MSRLFGRWRIHNRMDAIFLATVKHRMRFAQAQVPAFALLHHDSPTIQLEVDRITGLNRNMQSDSDINRTEYSSKGKEARTADRWLQTVMNGVSLKPVQLEPE